LRILCRDRNQGFWRQKHDIKTVAGLKLVYEFLSAFRCFAGFFTELLMIRGDTILLTDGEEWQKFPSGFKEIMRIILDKYLEQWNYVAFLNRQFQKLLKLFRARSCLISEVTVAA
jgi:hypothetical protein